jgi:hypothetical protein
MLKQLGKVFVVTVVGCGLAVAFGLGSWGCNDDSACPKGAVCEDVGAPHGTGGAGGIAAGGAGGAAAAGGAGGTAAGGIGGGAAAGGVGGAAGGGVAGAAGGGGAGGS